MQTFLPFSDFDLSAGSLDRARLGKQRVETLQILQALDKRNNQGLEKVGWINHPATKMWDSFEFALCQYGKSICLEWISRGYKDTCFEKISFFEHRFENTGMPWWLGDLRIHNSHQAMLHKKNPEFYISFADKSDIQDYWWPV